MLSSQSIRLTAEVVKNLSAASGVAYMRLGAILTFLAAPNPARKSMTAENTEAGAFQTGTLSKSAKPLSVL